MRKGFFNGLITGGIIGAVMAMFATPQLKPYKKEMISRGKTAKRQARKTMKGMRRSFKDLID